MSKLGHVVAYGDYLIGCESGVDGEYLTTDKSNGRRRVLHVETNRGHRPKMMMGSARGRTSSTTTTMAETTVAGVTTPTMRWSAILNAFKRILCCGR